MTTVRTLLAQAGKLRRFALQCMSCLKNSRFSRTLWTSGI